MYITLLCYLLLFVNFLFAHHEFRGFDDFVGKRNFLAVKAYRNYLLNDYINMPI